MNAGRPTEPLDYEHRRIADAPPLPRWLKFTRYALLLIATATAIFAAAMAWSSINSQGCG